MPRTKDTMNTPYVFKIKHAVAGAVCFVSFILILAYWPWRSVPTGSRGVVTQFGKIIGIEEEGLAFVPPWRKLSIFNTRAESVDVKGAEGATSDTQPVTTSLTVRYSTLTNEVAKVFEQYSHDGNLDSYIMTATLETFKAVTAKYTAPDLIAKRAQVSSDISSALKVKVALYGAQIINIDMTQFKFSDSYMAAINAKVTQEQLRLVAENELKTVESQQKQKVAVAEAEANALKAQADGEAYANLKLATAQADALKVQNNALSQNKDVLELRRIEVEKIKAEKWNGALPTAIYAGAPIPFLDVGKQYGSPSPRP